MGGPLLARRARKSVVLVRGSSPFARPLPADRSPAYIPTRSPRSGETLLEGLQRPVYLDDVRGASAKGKSAMKERGRYVISKGDKSLSAGSRARDVLHIE